MPLETERPIEQPLPGEITPERQPLPEVARVQTQEHQGETQQAATQPVAQRSARQQQAAPASDPVLTAIENVMTEGLAEIYARMDPLTQKEFKEEGERVATHVSTLLQKAHVQVRKIVQLLVGWLRLIPGVSSLFVEQEAKIKMDRLLAMKRKQR